MFKLTLEQQEKYKNQYLQWLQEENITIDDYKEFIADYTSIRNTINAFIDEFYNTRLEKTKENLVEYVYDKLRHVAGVTHAQTKDEILEFGYWDIEFGTVTISLTVENNILKLSNFFNGYPHNSDDIFEDIEINILEGVCENK